MRNHFLSKINIESKQNYLLYNIRTTKNKSLLQKLERNFLKQLFGMQLKINIIIKINFKIIHSFFPQPIMNTILISQLIKIILNIGHMQLLFIHINENISDVVNNIRIKDNDHDHIGNREYLFESVAWHYVSETHSYHCLDCPVITGDVFCEIRLVY